MPPHDRQIIIYFLTLLAIALLGFAIGEDPVIRAPDATLHWRRFHSHKK